MPAAVAAVAAAASMSMSSLQYEPFQIQLGQATSHRLDQVYITLAGSGKEKYTGVQRGTYLYMRSTTIESHTWKSSRLGIRLPNNTDSPSVDIRMHLRSSQIQRYQHACAGEITSSDRPYVCFFASLCLPGKHKLHTYLSLEYKL